MIFVTVGTHTNGFNRLIKAADDYAAISTEEVVIQQGSSTYTPLHAKSFRWATGGEIENMIRDARIVIAHAGAGTVIQVFQLGKPLIIVPRLRELRESYDDHQNQLANALTAQGRAILVMQPTGESLLHAVGEASNLETRPVDNSQIKTALYGRLATWELERKRRNG